MDGSSFFVLTKIKTERMNRMKNKPNLWNSVSVLVVAVLIVTAFIYFVITYVLKKLVGILERRLRAHD